MKRLIALILALLSVPAFAARTERALIPGQGRFVYDSTARQLILELENFDRFWVSRYGFDGRQTGEFMLEDFAEGAGAGLGILQNDGTAFDGATGVNNVLYLANGNAMQAASLGAGQTLPPAMVAGGLNIGGDQAADEGYEVFSHALLATGKPLVIGTTPAFSFEVGLTVEDVSGSDDLQCGLRKVAAVNAAINSYTDYATLGWNAAANPADIDIETDNDGAGVTTTNTTDTLADGVSTNWKFFVSATGAVTYTIDGAAPTVTAAYSFDDGDLVIPFCRVLNDTALAGAVTIDLWQVQLQSNSN